MCNKERNPHKDNKISNSEEKEATRYQLPDIRQHLQCAPRHEVLLYHQILLHAQPDIIKKDKNSRKHNSEPIM